MDKASRKGARDEGGHSTTTPATGTAPAASAASTGDALIACAAVVHEGTIRKATVLDQFLIECGVNYLEEKDMRMVSYILKQFVKGSKLNNISKMKARKCGHLPMIPPRARPESGGGLDGSKVKGGGNGWP